MVVLCDSNIRLRPVNLKEDMSSFLAWYSSPDVIYYSEGPNVKPYGKNVIKRMFKVLSEIGEYYVIEIREDGAWKSIGDASITPNRIPITIGVKEYWGKGFGSRVLLLLINRAREIGLKELVVSGIYEYNERSLHLYSKAGFSKTERFEENGYNCIKMELKL